jgi:hypothetical protein
VGSEDFDYRIVKTLEGFEQVLQRAFWPQAYEQSLAWVLKVSLRADFGDVYQLAPLLHLVSPKLYVLKPFPGVNDRIKLLRSSSDTNLSIMADFWSDFGYSGKFNRVFTHVIM